jgi:hypothetical protein
MSTTKRIKKEFAKYCKMVGYKIPILISPRLDHAWATTWKVGNHFCVEFSRRHFCLYPDEITETVIHEIAHIIAYVEEGHWGHGYPWKKIVRELGGTGSSGEIVSLNRRSR